MGYRKQEQDECVTIFDDLIAYYDNDAEIFTVCERGAGYAMLSKSEALALAEAIIKHFKGDAA